MEDRIVEFEDWERVLRDTVPAALRLENREAGAVEKSIPFYVVWVRRFFERFPGRSRRDLGRTKIEAFLAETSGKGYTTNWQLSQARAALELYYERFRGIALAPRPDGDGAAPAPSPVDSSCPQGRETAKAEAKPALPNPTQMDPVQPSDALLAPRSVASRAYYPEKPEEVKGKCDTQIIA